MREGTARRTGKRILLLLAPVGAMLGVGAVYIVNPSRVAVDMCLVHAATGLYCPGCGMTRALYALLHGDILMALRCNAFVFVAIPLLGYLAVSEWLSAWCGRRVIAAPAISKRIWIPALALLLVFCVLRNLSGEPFIYWIPPGG